MTEAIFSSLLLTGGWLTFRCGHILPGLALMVAGGVGAFKILSPMIGGVS